MLSRTVPAGSSARPSSVAGTCGSWLASDWLPGGHGLLIAGHRWNTAAVTFAGTKQMACFGRATAGLPDSNLTMFHCCLLK